MWIFEIWKDIKKKSFYSIIAYKVAYISHENIIMAVQNKQNNFFLQFKDLSLPLFFNLDISLNQYAFEFYIF